MSAYTEMLVGAPWRVQLQIFAVLLDFSDVQLTWVVLGLASRMSWIASSTHEFYMECTPTNVLLQDVAKRSTELTAIPHQPEQVD